MSITALPPDTGRPAGGSRATPFILFLSIAIAVVLARLAFIAKAMPSGDELYIWNGARDLQLCYRDFPFLAPLVVRIGTELLGDTTLGIRVLFLVAFTAVALHAWRWAARELRDEWAGMIAGLLALGGFAPLAIGAVYASTDSVVALAWYFATWFLWRAARSGRASDWVFTGMALLAGCLAKYLMVIWVAGAFVYLLMDRDRRRWLLRPQPYLALAIGALSAVPFLVWNVQNDWTGLLFQVSERHDVKPTLRHVTAMVGGQFVLVLPILFGALALAIRRAILARANHPKRDLLDALVVFTLATLVFLTPIAILVRVSPLWPAVGYLPAAILVAWWAREPRAGRRARFVWIAAGLAITAAVLIPLHAAVFRPQSLFAIIGNRLAFIRPTKLSVHQLRSFHGWRELAAVIDARRRQEPRLFVASPKSSFCSFVSFYTDDRIPTYLYRETLPDGTVLGETSVNTLNQILWQDTSGLRGRPGLFVTHQRDSATTERFGGFFRDWRLVDEVPVVVNGEELRRFYIFRGDEFAGWPTSR